MLVICFVNGFSDAFLGIFPLFGFLKMNHVEQKITVTSIHACLDRLHDGLVFLLLGGFVGRVPITDIGSSHDFGTSTFYL